MSYKWGWLKQVYKDNLIKSNILRDLIRKLKIPAYLHDFKTITPRLLFF